MKTTSHNNGYNLTIGGEGSSTTNKKVICLKTKEIYSSVRESAIKNNITDTTMIDWCKKRYNFMYYNEYMLLDDDLKTYYTNFNWEEFLHNKLSNAHSRENLKKETLDKYKNATSGKNNPRAFCVYCPELNEKFWGAKEAYDKYGINRSSISECIKGKIKHAGKHPIIKEPLTWIKIEK